jgi:hypothetical protein
VATTTRETPAAISASAQGHIGGRTLSQGAGLLKGNHLGVVAAVIFMEAFPHQLVAPNQDAAHGRVGRAEAYGPFRLL